MATEHHAVLDPLQQLQREGFSVTLLTPGPDGLISPEQLEAAITPETRLVSVMAANNEIGVLQPLEQLGALCRRHGITLHSDGAQAFGTLPLNPDALGVDLLSLSAHKLYGPKGIGALVLREGIAIEPLQWGGGQEAGLRAGTLPTALIVGFAAAARLALQEQEQRNSRLQHLRDQLWEGLQQRLPGVLLNGALQPRLPHNLNISLPGVNGSRLHRALRPHLACSSGSACSNGAPSHVLQAIGRSRAEAEASLRLSLGRETTADDVDQAITAITDAVALPPGSSAVEPVQVNQAGAKRWATRHLALRLRGLASSSCSGGSHPPASAYRQLIRCKRSSRRKAVLTRLRSSREW